MPSRNRYPRAHSSYRALGGPPIIYEYKCPAGHGFDVIKALADLDREEPCPQCSQVAERQISLVRLDRSSASDWNNPHFSPVLGQAVKGDGEARKIAKSRGMEEVGNEPVENLHKSFEKKREEKSTARWADDREMKYS